MFKKIPVLEKQKKFSGLNEWINDFFHETEKNIGREGYPKRLRFETSRGWVSFKARSVKKNVDTGTGKGSQARVSSRVG